MQAICAFLYTVDGETCRDTLYRLDDDAYLMKYSAACGDGEKWERMTEAQALQRISESMSDMVAPGPVVVEAMPPERMIG